MRKAQPIWEHCILRHRFGVSEHSPVEVLVSESNLPAFVYDMHFELEIGIVMEGAMEHEYPNGLRRREVLRIKSGKGIPQLLTARVFFA